MKAQPSVATTRARVGGSISITRRVPNKGSIPQYAFSYKMSGAKKHLPPLGDRG
jgi:hypothetical protein